MALRRSFLTAGYKSHQCRSARPVPRVPLRPPPPRRLTGGTTDHQSLTLSRCSNNHAGYTLTLPHRGLNHASPLPAGHPPVLTFVPCVTASPAAPPPPLSLPPHDPRVAAPYITHSLSQSASQYFTIYHSAYCYCCYCYCHYCDN